MTTAPPDPMTPEEARARSRRNLAIGLALAGFVVLMFVLTLVRLKAQVLEAGVF